MTSNSDYIENIRQQLISYIDKTKRSQASMTKELGISTGTLSQFISNTYLGSNDEVASKIAQFLKRAESQSKRTKLPPFSDKVNNTKKIYNALSYTHDTNIISVVIGDAGCGKTTSLQSYAAKTNGAVYIQADATKSSPRSVLKMILTAMGENCKGSSSDILDNLVEELTGTNKLIIVDEAQHLTERSFDTIRALNDKAGVGIIYAGTPDILVRMLGGVKAIEFDQVYSRIGYTCELKNEYTVQDIEHIFDGFNLDKTVIKYLFNASLKKGGLRYMVNLYKIAQDMAQSSSQQFSTAHLDEASKCVGLRRRTK